MSPKQLRFCQEYIIDLNGTQAAIRAGYSAHTAATAASKLLKLPQVKAAIDELQTAVAGKLGVTAERVIAELARLAFNDPRKFFDEEGRVKQVTELDDDTAMSLAGIETFHKIIGDEKDGLAVVTKVKISDKRASLELLGRHLNLFKDVGSKDNPFTIDKLSDDQLNERLKDLLTR